MAGILLYHLLPNYLELLSLETAYASVKYLSTEFAFYLQSRLKCSTFMKQEKQFILLEN
jgi:hypothetical protein